MSIFIRFKYFFIFLFSSVSATLLFQNCAGDFQTLQFVESSSRIPASLEYGTVITNSPGEYGTGSKTNPDEFSLMSASYNPKSLSGSALAAAVANLPTKVDNSTRPSFPPIINQGTVGSCYAMATVYYTASNELCRSIPECDNRNPLSSRSIVLSPRWIHSLFSRDNGLNGSSAYSAAEAIHYMGGVLQRDYPFDDAFLLDPAEGLKAQPTLAQVKEGLRYRVRFGETIRGVAPYNLLSANDVDSDGVSRIKLALASGRVATLQTLIFSFRMGDVAFPNGPSGVRERAVTHICGGNGTHEMTVVGYDDNIWIDVNRNGVEDAGERGAYKVANSWGIGWGNKGFIWVPYDAHRPHSAVMPLGSGDGAQDCSAESATQTGGGIPMRTRLPFTMGWNLIEPLLENGALYQPRLVVELNLKSDPNNLSGPFMISGRVGEKHYVGSVQLNFLSAIGIPQFSTVLFDLTPNLPTTATAQTYGMQFSVNRSQFPQVPRKLQSLRASDYWDNERSVFETSPTSPLESSATQEQYLFSYLNLPRTIPKLCRHWQLLYNGLCVDKTQSCSIMNGTGERPFVSGSYRGSCVAVGCNTGYVMSENTCLKEPTVPDAPLNVRAESLFDSMILVSFDSPVSDGGRPISNYKVNVSPGNMSSVIVSSSPAAFNGLAKGISYRFTVTASNSLGSGIPSAPSNSVVLGGAASDLTAPVVTHFRISSTSPIRSISNITVSASDNIGVTGYLITESASVPSPTTSGWSITPPTSFTFSGSGSGTLTAYAWAKDAAGNISASQSATVVVTQTIENPTPQNVLAYVLVSSSSTGSCMPKDQPCPDALDARTATCSSIGSSVIVRSKQIEDPTLLSKNCGSGYEKVGKFCSGITSVYVCSRK